MLIDFVLNPFGADMADLVAMAQAADEADVGAVWLNDHFSGQIVGAQWSRDPFVCLGAVAAVTDVVDIGLLVANAMNRHPVQLASAVNSVQSLAPGRVRLGVGSGAAPGSRFAAEHEMIGRPLAELEVRRALLRDSLDALRALWGGEPNFASETIRFTETSAVLDGAPTPQLIVGASAWSTIEVAVELADGVNIRRTAQLSDQLDRLARMDLPDGFEVSVLDMREPGTPLGTPPDDVVGSVVDRYVVTLWPGRDLETIRQMPRRTR